MTSNRRADSSRPSSGVGASTRWRDGLAVVVAVASYAVLLDVAIETWWSGSAIRWWVGAAVAAHGVGTALSWKRITWQGRATISTCVFLGVVAMTAWLPGGLSDGLRLAGRPTPILLSLLSAAGVALAGSVIWRFRPIPRAMRAAIALLAGYGLIAFTDAIFAGAPFAPLFSGDSAWQRLPSVLQGAFLAGVVVLPLALLTSVVRAGIPRFREGSPRYAFYQIVALGTSLAVVLAALPGASPRRNGGRDRTAGPRFGMPGTRPIIPSASLSGALESSLRALEDGERESPRDRWDPAYVVEHVGKDPKQLFDWVADNTRWIPYRGLLRGPVGVLMDRTGNSLDRAVLLATLLQQAGHSVRLAHGELAAEQAAGLLPALIAARPAGPMQHLRPALIEGGLEGGDVKQVAAQYSLDGPAIEQRLGSYAADSARVFSGLETRVADQTERLRTAVGVQTARPDRSARIDQAIELLRDHWWVQRQDGASWVDLDLLSPNLLSVDPKALTTAQETVGLEGVSTSQLHQIVVRVVAEQRNGGQIAERVALQHTLRPAELVGKPVVLRFWPRRWPAKANPGSKPKQYIRTVALAQHEWVATLQIGRDTAAQASLLDTGEINAHPALDDFAKIGGATGGTADDAASLLRGLTPGQTHASDRKAVLTAVWFEFEIQAPGEPRRTARHTVFDLLGPTARASRPVPEIGLDDKAALVRSLSLMMETEILPIACRIAPEFLRHLVAESLLSNRQILRALVRGEISDTSTRPDDLAARLAPVPGPLYPLAIARFDRSRVGDRIDVVRPNLLTRHVFPAPAGGDRIVLRDATDIVANEVGVDLRVHDAFAVRFEQGVFDTNAEALLQAERTVPGSTANAFAVSGDWVTLTSADRSQLESLRFSDDDRRRVAQDLAAGSVVVMPKAPMRVGADEFVGWWRIDPARGDVLGVDTRGWGQATAEYTLLTSVVIGFELGWLMCEVPPPGESDGPVASSFPGMDYVVAPVAAAGGSTCLAAGIEGAVFAAIVGLMGGVGGGGSGSSGGKSGSGGGAGAGAGRGGAGAGGSGSAAGSSGGTGGSGGASGNGGSGGSRGAGGQYRGPGGATPSEDVDPLGKTQPGGPAANEPKTDVSGPPEMEPVPEPTPPRTGPPTQEELAAAESAAEAAGKESLQATGRYVRYHSLAVNKDPSFDPVVEEANLNEANLKADESIKAIQHLKDLQAAARQAPGKGGGGFPPPRPPPKPAPVQFGCPPNCGNENKTGSAQDVVVPGQSKSVVGAIGVGNVLSGK